MSMDSKYDISFTFKLLAYTLIKLQKKSSNYQFEHRFSAPGVAVSDVQKPIAFGHYFDCLLAFMDVNFSIEFFFIMLRDIIKQAEICIIGEIK